MVDMYYNYFDFNLQSLSSNVTDFFCWDYSCSIFLIKCFSYFVLFFFLFFIVFFLDISFFSVFSSRGFSSFFSYLLYILDVNCEFQDLDEFIFFLFHTGLFLLYFYLISFFCTFLGVTNYLLLQFYFFIGFACFLIFSLCISYGVIFFQSVRGMSKTSFTFMEFGLDMLYVFIMFFRCFLQCFRYIIVMLFFMEVYLCCYDWVYLVDNNVCYKNFFIEFMNLFIYYLYTIIHFFIINLSQIMIFVLIYIFIFFMLYTKYSFYVYERYFNFII
jgi:hypothetical protein